MTASQPLVSIITPSYNVRDYLGECVESVLNQTYANWEMWIVDDASTDETPLIAEAYAQQDPRVHFVPLVENSGDAAHPRNVALSRAQGSIISFLDSDDMFLPQKLEKSVAFMQETDAAIAYHSMRRVSPDGQKIGHEIKVPDRLDQVQFMQNTCINMSSSLISRDKIPDVRFEESAIKGREDLILWVKLLKDHEALGFNDPLTLYRRGHESVSSNVRKAAGGTWEVYKRYAPELTSPRRAIVYGRYALNAVKKRLKF